MEINSSLVLALLVAVIMQMKEYLKLITSLRMTCVVNVFIVRLEHAILYPECINTKKSTVSGMRWE